MKRIRRDEVPQRAGAADRGRAALDLAQRNAARLRQAAAEHTSRLSGRLDRIQARHVSRLMGGHAGDVELLVKRHAITLAWPAFAAVATVFFALSSTQPFIWTAVLVAIGVLLAWPGRTWSRLQVVLRVVALELLVFLVAAAGPLFGRLILLVAGPAYLVWSVIEWSCDVLIFTPTHYWHVLGVIGTDSPRVRLTSLRYSEVQQGPVGRLFGWATLRFDTPVQEDRRLQQFGPVADPHNQMAAIDALAVRRPPAAGPPEETAAARRSSEPRPVEW